VAIPPSIQSFALALVCRRF